LARRGLPGSGGKVRACVAKSGATTHDRISVLSRTEPRYTNRPRARGKNEPSPSVSVSGRQEETGSPGVDRMIVGQTRSPRIAGSPPRTGCRAW
jgi:hypothetical protein